MKNKGSVLLNGKSFVYLSRFDSPSVYRANGVRSTLDPFSVKPDSVHQTTYRQATAAGFEDTGEESRISKWEKN